MVGIGFSIYGKGRLNPDESWKFRYNKSVLL